MRASQALMLVLLALAALTATTAAAQQAGITDEGIITLAKAIGAGLAVGLAGIGGGYAVAVAGASAISAVAEKREVFGVALLFVVLGEGIAIYGLLIAIILIFVV